MRVKNIHKDYMDEEKPTVPVQPMMQQNTEALKHGMTTLQPVNDMSAYEPKDEQPVAPAPVVPVTEQTGRPVEVDRTAIYPTISEHQDYPNPGVGLVGSQTAGADGLTAADQRPVVAKGWISSRVWALKVIAILLILSGGYTIYTYYRFLPSFTYFWKFLSLELLLQPLTLIPLLAIFGSLLLGIYLLIAKRHAVVNVLLIMLMIFQGLSIWQTLGGMARTSMATYGMQSSPSYSLYSAKASFWAFISLGLSVLIFALAFKARSDVAMDAIPETTIV